MTAPARTTATLAGLVAVVIWSTLTLFTAASGQVPPFQLTAMAFFIAGLIGLLSWVRRPHAAAALRQPWPAWALGVSGLFGYHFFYFTAIRNAPPVEASLVNYLWPLLIVVFSAALPGEKLRAHHIVGAALGLFGTALIVTGGEGLALKVDYLPGYAAAFVAALLWSSYSVISRRFSAVPSDAVTGFCFATSALSAVCHLLLETTVWPATTLQWLAVIGLGLGPVGGAFYIWDHAVKHGDIQIVGASAYGAPLMSTLLLIALGYGAFTLPVAAATLLITLGAMIAAKDMIRRRR